MAPALFLLVADGSAIVVQQSGEEHHIVPFIVFMTVNQEETGK